ncbi:hypothetical protein BL250_13750 [Erwinia sp. OLTSP20]|nr:MULTISPECIES: lysis protein [unclassified Erwinia]PIJ70543.1 hypothetical protein BK416_13345 [Erwinia sp. OLSSP12]PIJ78912.1 hypothetical protein BLD47_16090 [Erwinia sp. OLCASP19]PIJ81270.1 hypothetical protein BLD46_13110 [Erwinia sp. OLMTSP26]PIJ84519.1 hypothetical protein BLD49_12315 [Erwinia sp. OLMDSP33]PIJ89447.1 hypothetical protein BL249_16480 [Erwinia sp. OLFS4]
MAVGILVVGIVVAGRLAFYYRDSYHHALDKQREFAQLAETRLDTINNMQRQQREVADLDSKYTRELTNARLENDRLRDDVAAGRRQLRIKGTCKLSETTASSSMGNGSTIEVSRETGSTVFDIRSGIISDQQKLRFLQEYVKKQCH